MWIGELAMNVWMRIDLAGRNASPARRMSFSFARAHGAVADRLRDIVHGVEIAVRRRRKPASMTSTHSRSSCRAMRVFSSFVIDAPGLCSPSRNVVSKMIR
jgi:hypothetical protein